MLPDECLVLIFVHASLADTHAQLALVCRRWRRVLGDRYLWERMLLANNLPLPVDSALFRRTFVRLFREELVWQRQKFAAIEFKASEPIASCLSICLSDDVLVAGSGEGVLSVIARNTLRPLSTIIAHSGPVSSLLADGNRVLSAGFDGHVHEWDSKTLALRSSLKAPFAPLISCLAVASNGHLITGHVEGFLCVWSGSSLVTALRTDSPVFSLAAQGGYIVCGGSTGSISLYELHVLNSHGQAVAHGRGLEEALLAPCPLVQTGHLEGHTGTVMSATFSPDSSLLATASYDGTVRVWSLPHRRCLHVLEGHSDRVYGAQFASNCLAPANGPAASLSRPHRLLSWGEDKRVLMWDLRDPEHPVPLGNREPAQCAFDCAVVAPNMVVLGCSTGDLIVYDMRAPFKAVVA